MSQAALLHQRSLGSVVSTFGQNGLLRHREDGCLKLRMPQGGAEAILINTSGGLAGGDHLSFNFTIAEGAHAAVTTQAAERVYHSLGPAADISCTCIIAPRATLLWMPQETILFNGAALRRRINVSVAEGSTFLAVESVILGRTEMGEEIRHMDFQDEWNVMRNGKLIHAERLRLGPGLAKSMATLGGANAFATVMMIAPHIEIALPRIREALGDSHAAGLSAWNGKLLARLVARDGFQLRKQLKKVLSACLAGKTLPRMWDM